MGIFYRNKQTFIAIYSKPKRDEIVNLQSSRITDK